MNGNYILYKIVNTVITATGTLLCIVAGFIPAPNGLLTDGSISLIQALPGNEKLVMILVPALLFAATTVMVAAGRYELLSLITVLAGACIFALMDLSFIKSSMAFTGTLLNEFGIVIALSGVLLHTLGTPKSESPKTESIVKTADPFLEAEPEAHHEAAVSGNQAGFYESFDNIVDTPSFTDRDSLEFQNTLIAALRDFPDIQEEAGPPAEDIATAKNTKRYTLVLKPVDEELVELIGDDSGKTEEAAVVDIPKKSTAQETVAAAQKAMTFEDTMVLDAGFIDQFINEE